VPDIRAEREGFEPSDPVTQVKSLAVTPIRPLSHLSSRAFASRRGADVRPPVRNRFVQARGESLREGWPGVWRVRVAPASSSHPGSPVVSAPAAHKGQLRLPSLPEAVSERDAHDLLAPFVQSVATAMFKVGPLVIDEQPDHGRPQPQRSIQIFAAVVLELSLP
jgi:hypothetical protein